MLQAWHNSNISVGMDLFSEIEDLNSLLNGDKNNDINCGNGFESFPNKCASLQENYSKEVDNTKKVEKSLAKCLKFYSKLCKKYEVQQKLINTLELTIKEKNSIIEESQKNMEKMTGLIRVYENERTSFKGPACDELKRDKELLLDICCKLIGGADRRSIGKLILRKFRKDLNDDKINMVKQKFIKTEEKYVDDVIKPPDLLDFSRTKMEFKFEEKYSKELKKEEIKDEPPKEIEHKSPGSGSVEAVEEVSNISENVFENIDEEEDKHLKSDCTPCAKELPSLPVLEDRNNVLERVHDITKSNNLAIPLVTPPLDSITVQPAGLDLPAPRSIFDVNVPNDCFSGETVFTDSEICFGANVKVRLPSEEESFTLEEEVNRIMAEMTIPRLLSPIPIINEEVIVPVVPEIPQGCELTYGRKRPSDEEGNATTKKMKPCGPLDSIMSAMSLQNEVFKSNQCPTSGGTLRRTRSFTRANEVEKSNEDGGSLKENSFVQKNKQQAEEKLVRQALSEFVTVQITSKEDADENVRHCYGLLKNKSNELIAKCIVALVLENIDEPVEVFERPAPPLTKTQHRLIVLLSIFRQKDPEAENIPPIILSMISKKLFPDNFFWPDDSVEAATRFYAALCRSRNDTKNIWRFCIHAMTTMRQRCPMTVFAVLQTWPDVLHNASTLKNNILALTLVNLFLHMPKSEGLRNLNQKRKLMALKHLLMNFYEFKVEDTIENHSKKVFEGVLKDEVGAEKSLVMLAKCRDKDWVVKNIVPVLKGSILDWGQGKVDDEAAQRILSVIKQISLVLSEENKGKGKVKEMVFSLCQALVSGSKCHELEVQIVEVLLQLKTHEEARKAVSEWKPKKPIDRVFQNEIINISAENVLKEWKRNNKREPKTSPAKQKPKKKSKGKRKRKKRKSSSGVSS